MENLSSKMELFSQLIACGQNLSYWELDPDLQVIRTTCPLPQLYHGFFLMDESFSNLRGQPDRDLNRPVVYTNSIGLSWLCAAEVVQNAVCRVYLVGPAFNSDISYISLEHTLTQKHYPRDLIRLFMDHIQELPTVSLELWMRYGLMLHYCVTGEKLEISDLQYEDMATLHPAPAPADDAPSPKDGTWYAEQMVLKMVEEGRIDYKQSRRNLSTVGSVEVFAKNPSLRKMKNYLISLNCLVTRAAIRGGLDAATAYHLGEVYQNAIESASSVTKLLHVSSTMYEDFIRRVHKARTAQGISPAVMTCCNYIDMHLGEKLTMQTLAAQVGYADYYLAQKFKKEMGLTVSQYIRQRRVEEGKLLLKGSNQSIASIAVDLGFANSSHFSDAFRTLTGMTPAQYRESGE